MSENIFKGTPLDQAIKKIKKEAEPLSSVDRMALLKELVKVKPNATIDERRRAQALLRSLAQGRDYGSTPSGKTQRRSRPAVGRTILTKNMGPSETGRTNVYDVSFFNSSSEAGVSDRPFKGGLKDSKLKALKYMLGQALDKDIPKNSTVEIEATDRRRMKAYERDTKGALKFKPFQWNTRMGGGNAKSYKNKSGNFQPIVEGKFTKSAGNPGDALRNALIRAATSDNPYFRSIPQPAKFVQAPGPAVFEMFGKPIVEGMLKTIGKPGQSKMSKLGI